MLAKLCRCRYSQLRPSALSRCVLELYRVGMAGFGGGGAVDAGAGASLVGSAFDTGPRTTGLLVAALGSEESKRASGAGGMVVCICIAFSSMVSKEL